MLCVWREDAHCSDRHRNENLNKRIDAQVREATRQTKTSEIFRNGGMALGVFITGLCDSYGESCGKPEKGQGVEVDGGDGDGVQHAEGGGTKAGKEAKSAGLQQGVQAADRHMQQGDISSASPGGQTGKEREGRSTHSRREDTE